MAKEIYNEGRVVGLSAYELYLRHHKSSLENSTPPADEAAWLASSLGGGASLVLKVNPEKTPGDYLVPLPDNSTLCGASTITCSLFDGDADFDIQGWATRITSYGQLIKFTNSVHPEKDSNVVPDGDPWTYLDRQKMVDYLSITDGLVYQPGNWEAEKSQSETGPSAYDWSKESYMITNPTTAAYANTYKYHIVNGMFIRQINREIIINNGKPVISISFTDADIGVITLNGQSCDYRLEGAGLFLLVDSIKLKYNELLVFNKSGVEKARVYLYDEKGERETSISYVPNLNKTGYVKLRIDKELRQPIYLLLTGWLDKTILSSITKKDEGHVNYPNPQNGDFLGPEAYPWACKIVFTVSSNILDAISSKKYSRRIDTNGGDAVRVPAQPIIDFNHDDFEYYYNNNKYIGPRLTTHDCSIEELNVEGGSGAAITTISPNREGYIYPPAIYGSKLDEKSKSATLYPLDVAAPGTVKAFNNKNYALKYTSAVRGGYGIYVNEVDNDANMTLFDPNGNIHDLPSKMKTSKVTHKDGCNYYVSEVGKSVKSISLVNDIGEDLNTHGSGGTIESNSGDIRWSDLLTGLANNKRIDVLGNILKLIKLWDTQELSGRPIVRNDLAWHLPGNTSPKNVQLQIDSEGNLLSNASAEFNGHTTFTDKVSLYKDTVSLEGVTKDPENMGDNNWFNLHPGKGGLCVDNRISSQGYIRIYDRTSIPSEDNGRKYRMLFIQKETPSVSKMKDEPFGFSQDLVKGDIPTGSVWIDVH